jgi:uncharacterized protein YmfQ (DUF2313 family)
MSHAELLYQLLPPECYAPDDPSLTAQLAVEGNALDAALANADRALAAVTPFGAGETIPDWERVAGVTPAAGATLQQRIDAVIAKLQQMGSLSIPYFTQLAESLGYTITIDEPQYPQCGIARAGDLLYVTDIIWVWEVQVSGSAIVAYQAYAGMASAGDPITSFSDPLLEQVFNNLKPAFTYVYFSYSAT